MLMQIELTYTNHELEVLNRYAWRWWHALLMPMGLTVASLPGAGLSAWLGHEQLAVWGIALTVLAGAASGPWITRKGQQDDLMKKQVLSDTPPFLESTSVEGQGRWRWPCIKDVVEYRDCLLLPMGLQCWVIPFSAFASSRDRQEFERTVRERVELAGPFVSDEPPPAGPHSAQLSREICFQNQPADILAAQWRVTFQGKAVQASLGCVGFMGLAAVLQILGQSIDENAWYLVALGQFFSLLGCFLISMSVLGMLLAWLGYRRHAAWFHIPRRIQLTPQSLTILSRMYEVEVRWEAMQAVEADERYLYFFRRRAALDAAVVPRAAFASHDESERFLEYARRALAEAKAQKSSVATALPAPSRPARETDNPYQPPPNSR